MNKNEAKEIIKKTFSSDYSELRYKKFISNLFKDYILIDRIVENRNIKQAYSKFVSRYKIIGSFEDSGGYKIDILEVNLSKESILERARTAQRNFAAEYIKSKNKDAALIAFISPDNKEWRLSLVKLENSLEVVDEKLKTKEEITPAKRWSFLVGKNEGSHTAQTQFLDMLVSDKSPNLAELEVAFDIEKVTKEFFYKYTELYFKLKDSLDLLISNNEIVKKEFENKEISTVDFAKKSLGQIVFLYFLQKKGWFGVAPDKKWGEGPKKFLRELFERREKYGSNFFNDILEPLFYEALAQDRGEGSIYSRLNNCKMPFLNGGLFEPMNDYAWETIDIIIPDELFSNNNITKEKDNGDGILDVFDRYNFTVNENEPLEKEVAVDPEMLGKVFENLLDVKDRKSKGAFYTPREIVHYMCQESLINYLNTGTKNEIPRNDIEVLIKKGDRIIENDKIAITRQEERIKKYGKNEYKDSSYNLLLPISIRTKAEKLDNLLKNIKVADPAVGSGAFPLGMINEIVRARRVLNVYIKKNISDYDFKKHAITNSIYGVDIDPGAVDIAKLRLWLALVVDEEEPHPLPNLEHKIMQGNSLISEYEGIKLFDDAFLEDSDLIEKEKNDINTKISSYQKEYFELHAKNELTETKKVEIEKEIQLLKRRLNKIIKKTDKPVNNIGLFDIEDKQKIAQEKTKKLQSKIELFVNESRKTQKQRLKEEIDTLKWDLIEATLNEQGRDDKLEEIKKFRKKNIKPFFIWKLEFSDVFKEKGGFDVVIGNPPYIQLQKNNGELADMYEKCEYESFVRSGDIYCLFYELGNQLLQNRGHLIFITSNKWMRSGYGEKLRKYLSEKTTPKILIDLGPGVFETATVDTNILLYMQGKKEINCLACSVKENLNKKNIKLEDYINRNKILPNKFSSDAWIILNPLEMKIKEKIEKIGIPLKNLNIKINYGIKTGYNKAFIIDGKKKEELINKDSKNINVIFPLIKGKDIKKNQINFQDRFIIYSTKDTISNIEEYPVIKEHFLNFYNTMKNMTHVKNGGEKWWFLQSPKSLDLFKKKCIFYPDISSDFGFACSNNLFLADNTVYFLNTDNKFIFGWLNSSIQKFYYKNISSNLSDNVVRYFTQFVEKLPIPKITKENKYIVAEIERLVSQILITKNKDEVLDTKNLELQIDRLIYKIYNLTEKEIKIVEESFNNN